MANTKTVNAPLPGTILEFRVQEGDSVKAGNTVLILEAMKMENEIPAPADGVVKSLHVEVGATVNTNDLLVSLE